MVVTSIQVTERAPMTTETTNEMTCLGCKTVISYEAAHYGFGRCYQCQCEAHGFEIDMDATDGIEDVYRESFGFEPDYSEDDLEVMRGTACYLSDSPVWQNARERERLAAGVHATLTVGGDCSWEIPF